MAYVALSVIVLIATARVVTFPYSPEGWVIVTALRERSWIDTLLPGPGGPYYRPVWATYWKACDAVGLDGAAAHIGVVVLHVGAALLILRILRHAQLPATAAAVVATLAAIAPGTASSLSWFAAGNKAFVLFFLALACCLIREAQRTSTWVLAILAGACAIGSAENGYLAVLLLPAVALTRGHRRGAAMMFASIAAIAAVHLFVLSPQLEAGVDNRTAQLIGAMRHDFFGWALDAAGNLGRFFLHGIGVADNAPTAGKTVLVVLAMVAATRAVPGLGYALGAFLVLNVPATLFPGEASRHQAYLPAVGAGLVAGCLVVRLREHARGVAMAVCGFWSLWQGYRTQDLWADYQHHAQRVLESTEAVLPELAPGEKPVFINMPDEYRAAFELRFGTACEAGTWPGYLVLSTRTELLAPEKLVPPRPAGPVLEYDGTGLVRTTWEAFWQRRRAPLAWLTPRIQAYGNPVRAWDAIVGQGTPLPKITKTFEAPARRGEPGGRATLRLLAQGPLDVRQKELRYWEVETEVENGRWLVLGWMPLVMPATQNAWLPRLDPLPWAFAIRVLSLDDSRELDYPTSPALGILPAVWLEPGKHRLRVELVLRGG